MTVALSFEQAPPISVPFRFFLSAPLFGCLSGLLIAAAGHSLLESRWSGAVLALTHLLTLGFILQAVCGALLQLIPVAVGANIWRPQLVGALTHIGLAAGTVLLVCGFLLESGACFRLAIPLLGASLLLFLVSVALGLARTPARSDTLTVLRISVMALALTAALGIALAVAFGWQANLPLLMLVDLHVAWGLLGWALLLLVGVAFLVVPMFQLTPPYPKRFSRQFPVALLVVLIAWSLAVVATGNDVSIARTTLAMALAALAALFAVQTLRIQHLRRRRHVDSVFLFWRTGMLALLVSVALSIFRMSVDDAALVGRLDLAIGITLLAGFFVSVISGMFYKIVPFLSWLHLQKLVSKPPNMNQLIAEEAIRGQLRLHWVAVFALGAGLLVPALLVPAGLLFAASCAWLETNLIRAVAHYRRVLRANSVGV